MQLEIFRTLMQKICFNTCKKWLLPIKIMSLFCHLRGNGCLKTVTVIMEAVTVVGLIIHAVRVVYVNDYGSYAC